MAPPLKRLHAYFFRTPAGGEPVREWLLNLAPNDRKTVGTDIKDVEYAWPLGKPLVDSLGDGLWEVRSSISNGIARVIFYVAGQEMILLHGFVKKTQKTPPQAIDLAKTRMKAHKKGERP